MENKQLDKRHQRTDDISNQKTNGFKNSIKDQQQQNADTHRSKTDSTIDPKDKSVNRKDSKTGSDWNSKNQPTEQDHLNSTSVPSRNQHAQNNQTDKDQGKWEGPDMNPPGKDKPFNPNRHRNTESAGVIDEDRGPFQDEEMDLPSRKSSFSESVDTENSNIDSPKKNQAPLSNFS